MGRPILYTNPMNKRIHIRMTTKLYDWLADTARRERRSMGAVVRTALEAYAHDGAVVRAALEAYAQERATVRSRTGHQIAADLGLLGDEQEPVPESKTSEGDDAGHSY
jgi:hypothetical protein